jgi:hypothetical protein
LPSWAVQRRPAKQSESYFGFGLAGVVIGKNAFCCETMAPWNASSRKLGQLENSKRIESHAPDTIGRAQFPTTFCAWGLSEYSLPLPSLAASSASD